MFFQNKTISSNVTFNTGQNGMNTPIFVEKSFAGMIQ